MGAIVQFDAVRARSGPQERFWFAVVHRAWENLPDDLRRRFPDDDALRSYVLIRSGWCESRDFVASDEQSAAVIAAGLKWAEPYSIVEQRANVVFAYRAKSQKRSEMNAKAFKEITDRGLTILSEMLGCDPVSLLDAQEAA